MSVDSARPSSWLEVMLAKQFLQLWQAKFCLRPLATSFGCCRRQVLTLTVAQIPGSFEDENPSSISQTAYAEDPLFRLHCLRKGRVLQQVARQTLAEVFPSVPLTEPPRGLCANGSRRGNHTAEFDFRHGDRRVECKGTSMAFCSTHHRWFADWSGIKFKQAIFDDLFLVLHSPGWVDVVRHDGAAAVAEAGVRTAFVGQSVRVYAARGCSDAREARQVILRKLLTSSHACEQLATRRSDSGYIAEVVSQELGRESCRRSTKWYTGIPFAGWSPSSRGLRLQKLAFAIDQLCHPGCRFHPEVDSLEIVGALRQQRRGAHRGSADWWRGNVRVEFKSSSLSWDVYNRRWRAQFARVKFPSQVRPRTASFDELLLGLYTPLGLYLVQHAGVAGQSRAGRGTDTLGHSVMVYGPTDEKCPEAALVVVLAKLRQSGCELLAFVKW